MIRSKCFFLPSLIFLIFLCHCANPVTPEGGPKDITPPKVLKSEPPVATINFHNKDIRITFNEYIQLKDQNNQITIAPPLLPHTDIRLRGKSIVIDLKDTLKTNTTYSINFGNSISDLTENNVLKDFIYTFSTGTYIDSLTLSGRILSAFDLTPQKDVVAMLYINENDTLPLDSLPFHVKPYYIAKADEKGEFTFRNLRDVPLLLFALKDLNGDYIFNPPGEKVAFRDSLVKGIYIKPPSPELLKKDSIVKHDTIRPKKDTAIRNKEMVPMNTLLMFEESDSVQKIVKADMVSPGQVGIIYRFPAVKPEFIPLNIPDNTGWMIPEFNAGKDSVFLWLRSVRKDSLVLRLSAKDKIIDTARIDLRKKNPKKSKGEKGAVVLPKLQISTNMPSSRLNQFTTDPLIISAYPLSGQDLSRIRLVDGKDTVKPKVVFADTIKRKLNVSYKWKEEHPYKLIVPDSIFHAINGQSNDSVLISFKTYSVRDFGSIEMDITVDNPSGNYIVQLLSEKENVLEQKNITSSGKVKFEYLFPAKYKIKVIFDHNRNGHWDTGRYSTKLQPEKVQYFDKIIEVRANWDITESWKF
ncbi:MAG: Ig-like domain-containing protein [Bacteroidetes bacterium]|nr:Ig-like domain-containing protein [Bacteroidota bacterium]